MPGPPPNDARVRRAAPKRPWQHAPAPGWQHGPVPEPPPDLTPAALEAWHVWFGAWWAAFWTPDDLPGIRQVVRIYNEVEKGQFQRAAELRMAMDTYGLTPKGRQNLRWRPPVEPERPRTDSLHAPGSARDRLRVTALHPHSPNGDSA